MDKEILHERKRIQQFESNFNLTRHINEVMIKGLVDITKGVENNHQEILKMKHREPTVAWMISYIQNKIIEESSHLDAIIAKYNTGQLAARHLGQLMDYKNLLEIDDRDTTMKKIVLKGESTITFHFAVRESSRDTKVIKIIPFKHWSDLTSEPKYMEYDGMEYAIYNKSSNCISGIEEPIERFIVDECLTRDFVDPKLNSWREVKLKANAPKPHLKLNIRYTSTANYIYCYPSTINFDGSTTDCPPEVFKLDPSIPFSTGNTTYKVNTRKLSLTQGNVYTDNIHPKHYTTVNKFTELLKALQELNSTNTKLETETIEQEKEYFIHKSANYGVIPALIIIIILFMVCRRRAPRIYETIHLTADQRPVRPPPLPPKNDSSYIKGVCQKDSNV